MAQDQPTRPISAIPALGSRMMMRLTRNSHQGQRPQTRTLRLNRGKILVARRWLLSSPFRSQAPTLIWKMKIRPPSARKIWPSMTASSANSLHLVAVAMEFLINSFSLPPARVLITAMVSLTLARTRISTWLRVLAQPCTGTPTDHSEILCQCNLMRSP